LEFFEITLKATIANVEDIELETKHSPQAEDPPGDVVRNRKAERKSPSNIEKQYG
jgi:hypothetical protein